MYSSDMTRRWSFIIVRSLRLTTGERSMTNTRRKVMIAGGLLVVATSVSYLMILRADHRAIAEAGFGDAAPAASAAPAQVTEPRAGDDHAVQGSIGQPASAAATATHADAAPQQPPVAVSAVPPPPVSAVPPPPPAPVSLLQKPPPAQPPEQPPARKSATLVPGQAGPNVSEKPQPPVQPSEPPSAAVASVDAQKSAASPANSAQHASRQRDGLERRAATNPVNTSETPETAALVRESAKLDPSLPPPQLPVGAGAGADRHGSTTGSNAVGAAMTERLVRESSSFKPSSPPPKDNPVTPQ
ncbi:extensin [Burkholderia ubonensis]|uniref:extensin n=1 Tax=Burkholderia ubonensis TaxID=101571 RepID=UPI002FC31BA2